MKQTSNENTETDKSAPKYLSPMTLFPASEIRELYKQMERYQLPLQTAWGQVLFIEPGFGFQCRG